MTPPDPTPGYRLLESSERIKRGDEYHVDGEVWKPLKHYFGLPAGGVGWIRRKIV